MSRDSHDEKHACRSEEHDYVIVGLGTAGAPLARYLSEDGRWSVLVIEGGRNREEDPLVRSTETAALDQQPRYHWFWPADLQPIEQPGAYFSNYTEGRMWGGSSGHNYLLAVRGSPDVYDSWATISSRWSYASLLPTMRFLETYTPNGTPINTAQRGTDGPLFVTQDPALPPGPSALTNAYASATNAPYVTDYNDPDLGDVGVGAGQFYVDPRTGERSWAAPAFLAVGEIVDERGRGLDGRSLRIESGAVVERVLFDPASVGASREPKAIGVRYRNDRDEIVVARAKRKVILCAGTIANPQILQRSGIGDRALLKSLGIDVVLHNPNVGRNMQTHYGTIAIIAPPPDAPPGESTLVAFTDLSGDNVGPPTGRREFQFLNFTDLAQGGTFVLGWDLRVHRLGIVQIQDANPTFEPLVDFNFWDDGTGPGSDLADAVRALKVIANVSIALNGILPFFPDPSAYPAAEYGAFGGEAPDDSLLIEHVLSVGGGTYTNHAVGTCRMSSSIADGVVDGKLDVHGIRHLAVADNSVQPTITTGNTAWPAYVIGLTKAKIEGADTPY